ncbi:MAG: serine hydrolase domain-containing protein [Halieaceae bacterium]|nr:serine hydrolase domain-containing protein [Halieaceae bacterium]
MRRALVTLVALIWSSLVPASQPDLQARVERILAEEQLTGIGWTLVSGPGHESTGTAGFRDNGAGIAFTTDTRFHVGSLTKAVLATGVLRLATEGRIDLDAPVLAQAPRLLVGQWPDGLSEVTPRHLLDHTAGINDAHFWQLFSERPTPGTPLLEAFPDPTGQLQVRTTPGETFSYSNMGYTLLAMLIEATVGERYEAYLDRELLLPLGMFDSTFEFTAQEGVGADPALAWGHIDDGSRYAARASFLRPAGQFTTTTADLARFAHFLMGDGIIDNRVFISKELMRSRGKPMNTESARAGLVAGYALGLGRRDRHGVVGYCHGGNIVGFVAMLCLFPEQQKAFAYSVNTDSETANYGQLDKLFIEVLGINPAPSPPTAQPAPAISDWYGLYVLSPNRFQMFAYVDKLFGAVRISSEGDELAMASVQGATRRLRPAGGHLFSASDRTTESHVFLRGAHGEHRLSDGFVSYQKVPAAYLAAHWSSMLLGLAGLVWLLVAGSASLLRNRLAVLRQPVAPAYLATVFLFLPVPLFMSQSFMALGDVTAASLSLALATLLLPVGMLLTLWRTARRQQATTWEWLHAVAATGVLQWSVVLAINSMIPFRLWS